MGPPSLPPSFPPFPPSLHPPPLFLGLAWFAPPCLCSYCKFLQHQQCLFQRHTFCGGAGEVPSGRPPTFCGGQWREGGLQGGSNGKGNCDSKFVLVAAPFTNPKGHIIVPWGLPM